MSTGTTCMMLAPGKIAVLLFVTTVRADADTYPIKSVNLLGAMQPDWYKAFGLSDLIPGLEEGHPVHGVQTSDGGFLITGKGTRTGGSISTSWALKTSSAGTSEWGWMSAHLTSNAANAVAELPASAGGGVLIAGYVMTSATSTAYRSLTKLHLATGAQMWETTTSFGDAAGSSGAWEMVTIASDGVVLAGLSGYNCQPSCADEMLFKSYGNSYGGSATIMKLPFATVSSSTAAPTTAQAASGWSVSPTGFTTSKSARPTPDGNLAVLMLNVGTSATALAKLASADGSIIWGPTTLAASIGEGTSIALSADGNIAMSGLSSTVGRWPGSTVVVARLSLINGASGALLWTQSFDVGGLDSLAAVGIPEIVRHECWGAVAMPSNGGYALICGTGIEPGACANANLPASVVTSCNNGIGDNRVGAVARAPDMWQSMVVIGGTPITPTTRTTTTPIVRHHPHHPHHHQGVGAMVLGGKGGEGTMGCGGATVGGATSGGAKVLGGKGGGAQGGGAQGGGAQGGGAQGHAASVLRDAARWCVSAGLASRRLSLRDGTVDLQFYDAQTHGVRLCFWDAYAQAVRPGRARTLRPADALCCHTPRSSHTLVFRPRRSSMRWMCRRRRAPQSGRREPSSTSSVPRSCIRSTVTSCGRTSLATSEARERLCCASPTSSAACSRLTDTLTAAPTRCRSSTATSACRPSFTSRLGRAPSSRAMRSSRDRTGSTGRCRCRRIPPRPLWARCTS